MNGPVDYFVNRASLAEITEHLSRCDADFVPPLSSRVEIGVYANKIATQATRFEAWSGGALVGLVATYCNNQESRIAWITSVSVLQTWMGKGVAAGLMKLCTMHARTSGMQKIGLEVASSNMSAIRLYEKSGFAAGEAMSPFVTMMMDLGRGEDHE